MRFRFNRKLPIPLSVVVQAILVWWDEWFLMIIMSLIWLFSWATIVLGPPVTFAFYDLAQKLVADLYPDKRDIVKAGRRFFTLSWRWMISNLLIFIILIANYLFYSQTTAEWSGILQAVVFAIGLFWLGIQFYALPYLMLQEHKSLRIAWRNGLFTILAAPGYTLILWIVAGLLTVLTLGTVVPILVGMPGILVVLGSQAVAERIEAFGVLERDSAKSGPTRDENEG